MHRRAFFSLAAASGLTALGAQWASPARVLAGACAPASFSPTYLTPVRTAIHRGGAILVGLTMGFDGINRGNDPFVGPYSLVQGDTTVPLRAVRTAPGLLRLVPPPVAAGNWSVRGPAGNIDVRIVDQAVVPPSPCSIKEVNLTRYAGSQEPYSPATWSLIAELRAPIAANVVGVVVSGEPNSSPYGLFAPATPGERTIRLYSSPGRCAESVPDANPPYADSVIRLAVVGSNGAISVRSNHVTIEE